MLKLADSHVHLDAEAFADDRAAVIARALDAGVATMVLPSVDAASWPDIRVLAAASDHIHPAYGLHPMYLANHSPDHLDALADWLAHGDTVAVGEIGLDFHVEGLDPALQRDYFSRQLELARQFDLPVIVHARAALEEIIQTLRRFPGLRGVVHSFSGSEQQARQLWQMGFHLGIGGPITYDRAKRLRRIVASMPLQYLLLESDAPDQPDCAHRGQRNEPARVVEVLRSIAALRTESESVIAAATCDNTRRLFGIDPVNRLADLG
ncbi:TatD family hydrolase [Rhodanobacter sp. BL-MT-08]